MISGIINPDIWKHFKLIGILKPNKDQNELSLYRVISLIPCLIKIMNIVIKSNIEWMVEK